MASTSSRVACVWGANGISGSAMIRVLVEQSRQEWSRIICISRRPTLLDIDDDRIYFLAIDITEASVDDLLRELGKMGGESITDVFYYAYIAKQDETELDDVNKRLLQKALDVTVRLAGAQIRCFSLQTGYKVSCSPSFLTVLKPFLVLRRSQGWWLSRTQSVSRRCSAPSRFELLLHSGGSSEGVREQTPLEICHHPAEHYHRRFQRQFYELRGHLGALRKYSERKWSATSLSRQCTFVERCRRSLGCFEQCSLPAMVISQRSN